MTSLPSADLGPFSALAASLQEITQALAATGTQREVLEIVLTPAVRALGAVAGIVLLVDHTDQQLKIAGSQGYEDVTLTIWQEGPLEDHQLISDILRMGEARYFEEAGALKEAYPDLESRTGALAAIANAALPMFLDGRPLGIIVLDFTEPHHFTPAERRFLTIVAAQCAVALGRAEAIRALEVQVEARTRQWQEERVALEAFSRFTEAVGSETDVQALVRQAITLLHETCGVEAAYFEREGQLFKATTWSPSADLTLLLLLQRGFPLQHSGIAQGLRQNTAAFIDHWKDTGLLIAESEIYQAVAGYPYFVEGQLESVLMIGSRASATWAERDKGIFRAVGRSLGLALERARFAKHLENQNAELYAQARTLEGVAQLARDLTLPGGPQQLIGQVMELVLSLLPSGYASYWEIEDGRWRLRAHRGDVGRPEWQAVRERGFSLGQFPSLDLPWQTRQPYYQGRYDPVRDAAPELTDHLISVATLPVMVRGDAVGVFGVGLFGHRQWSAADRALLETAVQSLGLVLERSAAAQQLEAQNVELLARTQTLESFAELLRDLTISSDAKALIQRAQVLTTQFIPHGFAVYYELEGEVWRLRSQVGSPENAAVQASLESALPYATVLNFRLPWESGEAFYQDAYDPALDQDVPGTAAIASTATLVLRVGSRPQGIFAYGLRVSRAWSATDKAVLQSVVRSLGLALERAEQARALTAQRDMLKASNEELEAFTYSVSHDLRTPVRHIISFGNLLRRSLPEPLSEKTARYLQVVEDAALQLNRLIDGMLELSRASRQVINQEKVDLGRLVQAGRQEVMLGSQRQITWQVSTLPVVIGDTELLRRVVSALLSNAVKYTNTREETLIEVWAEDRGQTWAVFVRDNGVGFDPRYQDKLFSMFQRLHRQEDFEGAGVSLTNARRIVARHGGLMTAKGQVNQGATFGFSLPKT